MNNAGYTLPVARRVVGAAAEVKRDTGEFVSRFRSIAPHNGR
jgi:hypothetical protein